MKTKPTKRKLLIKGDDINGASVAKFNGAFYLYYSGHKSKFISLATSDKIDGDYKIIGDVLNIKQTPCYDHIASPDIHVLNNKIVMYFHGVTRDGQKTFKATSIDGLKFGNISQTGTPYYHREFNFNNETFALCKNKNIDSVLMRFNGSKYVFDRNVLKGARHTSIITENDLYIFYTLVGEAPERIYLSKNFEKGIEIMRPLHSWEGANMDLIPSKYGMAEGFCNELRDPFVIRDNGKLYLFYTFGGEKGIAVTELI